MEREQQLANSRAAAEALGIPEGYLDQLDKIAATFDDLRRTGKYHGWGQPPESAGPIGIFISCEPSTFFAWGDAGYQVHYLGPSGGQNGRIFAEIRPPAFVNGAGT